MALTHSNNNENFNNNDLPTRRLRYEIGDGTPEGIYSDCALLDELDILHSYILKL